MPFKIIFTIKAATQDPSNHYRSPEEGLKSETLYRAQVYEIIKT